MNGAKIACLSAVRRESEPAQVLDGYVALNDFRDYQLLILS